MRDALLTAILYPSSCFSSPSYDKIPRAVHGALASFPVDGTPFPRLVDVLPTAHCLVEHDGFRMSSRPRRMR